MINISEYLLSKQNNKKTADSIVQALLELKNIESENDIEGFANEINKINKFAQYEDYYNMLIDVILLCASKDFNYKYPGDKLTRKSKSILNYTYDIKGAKGVAFEFIDIENIVCIDVIIDKFKIQIIKYSGFEDAQDYFNSINGMTPEKKIEKKVIFDSRKKKDPFDFDDILKKELFKQ